MNLMKEGLFERMTLGRHATKPASVCVMSSKAQRLADVLAWSLQERDGMIL